MTDIDQVVDGDPDAAMTRIDQARWWILRHEAFYGALVMSLADVIDTGIPTACTDGRVIRWNPTFVAGLSTKELRGVLMHETLHCAHGHLWRIPATE
jgi:predicted metal-dependent peptidase